MRSDFFTTRAQRLAVDEKHDLAEIRLLIALGLQQLPELGQAELVEHERSAAGPPAENAGIFEK